MWRKARESKSLFLYVAGTRSLKRSGSGSGLMFPHHILLVRNHVERDHPRSIHFRGHRISINFYLDRGINENLTNLVVRRNDHGVRQPPLTPGQGYFVSTSCSRSAPGRRF